MSSRIPWIEKFRPEKISEIILSENQMNFVNVILGELDKKVNKPVILTGNPGIGKTSTARCIGRKLLGENYHDCFYEINAGDRKIVTMKKDIPFFCSKIVDYTGTKVILFDEADNMTEKCQMEIKNYILGYNHKILFLFTCNESSKIISDIQSLARTFQFQALKPEQINTYLTRIADKEELDYTKKALQVLADIAEGDMRRGINYLHACAISGEKITPTLIYQICSIPDPIYYKKIIDACKEYDLKQADFHISELIQKGFNLIDIVVGLLKTLETYPDYEFSDKETEDVYNLNIMRDKHKILLSRVVSQTKLSLVTGLRTNLQMRAMVAKMIMVLKDENYDIDEN